MRSNHLTRPAACTILIAMAAAVCGPAAPADVVVLKDGRTFQGTVLQNDAQGVRLDTMIDDFRVTLGFDLADVQSVQTASLPADFFAPTGPVAASRPASGEAGTPFIEVPVIGRIGEQVLAEGLRRTLAYAAGHGIGHVVFYVDSQGGSLAAAERIAELLSQYGGSETYHSIVRDAAGVALVFLAHSRDIFLKPGAGLGGQLGIFGAADASTQEAARRQLALEAARASEANGRHGEIVRAMIDPDYRVAAWRNDADQVVLGAQVPDQADPARVIFDDSKGAGPLALSRLQAEAAGMGRPFNGGARDLGAQLGIADWRSEGETGSTLMADAASLHRQRQQTEAADYAGRVKLNVASRALTRRYIDSNLAAARQWDPNGLDLHITNFMTNPPFLSEESRRRWREWTDQSLHFLRRAHEAMRQMIQLDDAAKLLSLEPTYNADVLRQMLSEADAKIRVLVRERDRRTM